MVEEEKQTETRSYLISWIKPEGNFIYFNRKKPLELLVGVVRSIRGSESELSDV